MSTIFGIIITENGDEKEIEVAFRSNNGDMRWLNELAKMLPDDTEVTPLDNTAQGIFTIGDIKKEIKDESW